MKRSAGRTLWVLQEDVEDWGDIEVSGIVQRRHVGPAASLVDVRAVHNQLLHHLQQQRLMLLQEYLHGGGGTWGALVRTHSRMQG